MTNEKISQIALFRGKKIRKTIYQKEWWFVVSDIVLALTDTVNPSDYIKKMKLRDLELGKGWGQFVTPLSIETDGGIQGLNCANTEGIFRIIQSIPSPKAEPMKRWLAKVGGSIAGSARKQIERKIGKSIISKDNFLSNKKNILIDK